MTDPTGRSFISYRRSRASEARLLVDAHHDCGVPVWQDVTDLDEGPTEDQLRQTIRDPTTANGLLWITPEVKDSPIIRTVEAPELFLRARQQDEFFLVPVAAGGLDYGEATRIFDGIFPAEDLRHWNVFQADGDGGAARDALRRIIERRVKAIHRSLSLGEPLRIGLYTRARAPFRSGFAFSFDWLPAFNGRVASSAAWQERLLPALYDVADAIRMHAPGRHVEAEGLTSVPGAVALGSAFLDVRGVGLGWLQMTDGTVGECWSAGSRSDSGFVAEIRGGEASAADLGVFVEVTDLIGPALARSHAIHPPFRATITVRREGTLPHRINCPSAADIAHRTIAAIREARTQIPDLSSVHLFIAGPLAVAMMVGRLLNTIGPVQTYEHIADGGPGRYAPGCRVTVGAE